MIIQLAGLEAKRSIFSKIIPNKFSIILFCKANNPISSKSEFSQRCVDSKSIS